MNKIFVVLNPEGKAFAQTVSFSENECLMKFANVWFSGWGIHPDHYEQGVIWRMFKNNGFKLLEIDLPEKLETD